MGSSFYALNSFALIWLSRFELVFLVRLMFVVVGRSHFSRLSVTCLGGTVACPQAYLSVYPTLKGSNNQNSFYFLVGLKFYIFYILKLQSNLEVFVKFGRTNF